jgi:DinB superfamily
MSTISILIKSLQFNRGRTLATLDEIEKLPDPQAALAFRLAPRRAHIGWQLMHIGITEELFATERILATPPGFANLVPRFRGGSTPDDDIPPVERIRDVLNATRQHVVDTFSRFTDADLKTVPEPFKERGWPLGKILRVLTWHEAHHQGQAHATLNLYKAR